MSTQRLPTRVSNACDRCRRQKQRCDTFRPCTNCTNTNRQCVTTEITKLTRGQTDGPRTKRARKNHERSVSSTTDNSPGHSTLSRHESHHAEQGHLEDLQGWTVPAYIERIPSHQSPQSNPVPPEVQRQQQLIVAELGDSTSAIDISRKVLQARIHSGSTDRATFAIPGGDSYRRATEEYFSIEDLIGTKLPPKSTCDTLIDAYFLTVHWFSLVVYEPTFRMRYHAISNSNTARSSDRPFILLLLMVLVMSCCYGSSFVGDEVKNSTDLNAIRAEYLTTVRQNFMDLLDEDSLEFVQICALLGSYWLYWGKPKSSFIILGTAIKSAQAIALHRLSSSRLHSQVNEERKRVWWTIYTWDRFATIIYGRPLGINDRDCNVQMPTIFPEHVMDVQNSESADICLSQYQMLLNRVYHIASPLLENIYGIRYFSDSELLSQMPEMVKQIESAMRNWHRELPPHLDLDQIPDIKSNSTLKEKLHGLQALSLQLTYENLIIIIHRPSLADWSHQRDQGSRRASIFFDNQPRPVETMQETYDTSLELCLRAALKISSIQQTKPNLIRLARRTHLLSFLGMNLFTSSVVMFICALSDTLSNIAQEAKRGIRRNLMVLKSLSNYGSLSAQCSVIIEDLIQLIIEKEKDQMLGGTPTIEAETQTPTDLDGIQIEDGNDNDTGDQQRIQVYQNMNNSRDALGPYNDAAATLGRTMESLQRVLKDASNSRAQHRPDVFTNDASSRQPQMENPLWAPQWPESSNVDDLMGNNSLMQDMGQFWLWEPGPSTGDFSNSSWDDGPHQF